MKDQNGFFKTLLFSEQFYIHSKTEQKALSSHVSPVPFTHNLHIIKIPHQTTAVVTAGEPPRTPLSPHSRADIRLGVHFMGFMPHSHDYSILLQYIHCPKILCVPPLPGKPTYQLANKYFKQSFDSLGPKVSPFLYLQLCFYCHLNTCIPPLGQDTKGKLK